MTVLDEDPEPFDPLPPVTLQGEVKGWRDASSSLFPLGHVRVWSYTGNRYHLYLREKAASSGGEYGPSFMEFTSRDDAILVAKALAKVLGVGFSVDWNPDP